MKRLIVALAAGIALSQDRRVTSLKFARTAQVPFPSKAVALRLNGLEPRLARRWQCPAFVLQSP